MSRPSLPTAGDALVDQKGNATIPFNAWEEWADGRVITLGIGVGARQPIPPFGIVVKGLAVVPYYQWLAYINRSVATFGSPSQRASLPPSNFPILGVDRKATIPFYSWLRYVDQLLA
jgi:hypothetical protein